LKIDITAEQWLGEDNKLGLDILNKKYFYNDETLEEWINRVSGGDDELAQLILDKKFLFGGRVLSNRGLNNGNYFNCFSAGFVEDDYTDIMDVVKKLGLTYKAQGGQGISLSKLRPKGTPIGNRYKSDGIIPFMELYNTVTSITSQAGSRKGALLISLDIRHKEAESFINIKTNPERITKANLSLEIDDEFMKAVKAYYDTGEEVVLQEKREYSGHIVEYDIVPIRLYKKMMECAYEYGEPGCIFTNEFRNYNMLEFDDDYNVDTCNPSLRKGTQVLTKSGVFSIESLEGKSFEVLTLNNQYARAKCFLSGRDKQLYKIVLKNGAEYYCTPEHKWPIHTQNGYKKVETVELSPGDWLPYTGADVISDGDIGNYDDGFFFGYWYGDGSVTTRKDNGATQYGFTFGDSKIHSIFPKIKQHVSRITGGTYNPEPRNRGGEDWYEISTSSTRLVSYFAEHGVSDKEHLPCDILTKKSEQFRKGFIDGLFSSDGGVELCKKGEKLHLTTSKPEFAKNISDLLHWYGIQNSVCASKRDVVIGEYEYKNYVTYHLAIGRRGIERFNELFTLTNEKSREKLMSMPKLQRRYIRDNNIQIESVELVDVYDDVWDIHVYDDTHTFMINHCVTGNCGEQPLKKDTSCNLGSINLTQFIIDEYTSDARIDYESLRDAVRISVRALDDIIDENMPNLPLEIHKVNARDWRNIGLGVMGVGTALFKLGVKYDSRAAVNIVDELFRFLFREAVFASNQLAAEKGAFPKYSKVVMDSRIMKAHFSHDELKQIHDSGGLRNCSLLSIAPNGSISNLLGVTGGAEPEYAISYRRKTDNLDAEYDVYCDEARYYMKKFNADVLPDIFVCSSDIYWKDRIDIQAAMQKHIDTAISSTVNLPRETTIEEVEKLYLYAWEKKLKGITIFRDGCKRAGILSTHDKEPTKETTFAELERGMIIGVDDDLLSVKRTIVNGCGKFYLHVDFDENTGDPLETYIDIGSGGGCERNLQLISRLMSIALRAGVPVEAIIDQAKSIRPCVAYVKRTNKCGDTSRGSSCSAAIGFALEDLKLKMDSFYYNDDETDIDGSSLSGTTSTPHVDATIKNYAEPKQIAIRAKRQPKHGIECPECGEDLKSEGSCFSCVFCGYSKCD
jgi:ribonucleotide reductase alpha subunit